MSNCNFKPQFGLALENNQVNHPTHYGGADNIYEAIKVIEAWGLGFCIGNVVKYISRAGKKDDIIQDLEKAHWYLEREINRLKGSEGKNQPEILPGKHDQNPETLLRLIKANYMCTVINPTILKIIDHIESEGFDNFNYYKDGEDGKDKICIYYKGGGFDILEPIELKTITYKFLNDLDFIIMDNEDHRNILRKKAKDLGVIDYKGIDLSPIETRSIMDVKWGDGSETREILIQAR